MLQWGFGLFLIFSFIGTNLVNAQPYNGHRLSKVRQAKPEPILVKEYMLKEHGVINVFTLSGNIDLESVENTQKVRIELFADRGFSLWPQSDPLENYRITSVKRGDEISASVEKKNVGESGFWAGHTSFSFKITVPESVSTNLKTLNGHIILQNVAGRQTLKSNGGNIQITEANGMITAYTSGGDIAINNSKGTVFAKSDGGNIHTKNIRGELRIRSNGGTISSSGISGSMIAVDSGGDIEAQFDEVAKGINLTVNAGNIRLILPKTTGYGLNIRGDRIHFDEAGLFKGTYSQRLASGSLNGGGTPVNLTANAGTVTLQLKK